MSILTNTLKRIFGKRTNRMFMLIIPIVLNLFIIAPATKTVEYNIGIVDKDQTPYTMQLIETLSENNKVVTAKSKDELKSMVLSKKIDCAYMFDKDFTNQIINGQDGAVTSFSMENSNASSPITMYLESNIEAAKQIAKAVGSNEKSFYKAMEEYNKGEYQAQYMNSSGKSLDKIENAVSSLGYMAFGMIFFLTFATGLILEDKLSGVYDRVTASPLSRASYFGQHMLASFLLAVIQVLLLINILPKLVNISYGTTEIQQLQLIVVCFVFAAVCVSIGIFISRFSKNDLMAKSLASLINLPLIMLGGCLWPREIMPSYVQKIGDFMPTTWFLSAGKKVLIGNGIGGASHEIIYMLLFAILLLSISFVVKSEKVR